MRLATRTTEPTALTIAEAATWAGRSDSWIRAWLRAEVLEPVEVNGRSGVTVASLRALVRQRPRINRPPTLRLVVNNDRP